MRTLASNHRVVRGTGEVEQIDLLPTREEVLVTDFERQVRAEALVGRAYGSALYDNAPAGGSARGHGPRTPRYLHPQSGLGGTSQWRRDYTQDYTGSTLWEHLGTKQVLSDGAKEFRQLLRIPRELFDSIYTRAVKSESFPLYPVHDDHPPGHAPQVRGAPPVPLKVKSPLHCATWRRAVLWRA